MPDLILYNYFRSSTSYRVRIALEHKNLPYSYSPIHLLNNGGEQNSETYRKLNPVGGVPTLVHGSHTISQSVAIIEYLEMAFSMAPPLFPKDNFLAAKVRQFCETINSDIHPLTNLKVMQYLEKTSGFSASQKQEWIEKWIGDGLASLEKLLLPFAGNFCFGNEFTAADAFLVPQLFSAGRFNVEFKKYSTLNKLNETLKSYPAIVKAHPFRQPDTPADLRLPGL